MMKCDACGSFMPVVDSNLDQHLEATEGLAVCWWKCPLLLENITIAATITHLDNLLCVPGESSVILVTKDSFPQRFIGGCDSMASGSTTFQFLSKSRRLSKRLSILVLKWAHQHLVGIHYSESPVRMLMSSCDSSAVHVLFAYGASSCGWLPSLVPLMRMLLLMSCDASVAKCMYAGTSSCGCVPSLVPLVRMLLVMSCDASVCHVYVCWHIIMWMCA